MFNFIKDFMGYRKEQKRRTIAVKRYVIRQHLTQFYEDLQISKGEVVTIPPCTLANQIMKEVIKTDNDVNRIYKNLQIAGVI